MESTDLAKTSQTADAAVLPEPTPAEPPITPAKDVPAAEVEERSGAKKKGRASDKKKNVEDLLTAPPASISWPNLPYQQSVIVFDKRCLLHMNGWSQPEHVLRIAR